MSLEGDEEKHAVDFHKVASRVRRRHGRDVDVTGGGAVDGRDTGDTC